MKVNPKFLIMMAALAAGTAAAAPTATSAGTKAGEIITNTATASYTDPTGVSTTPLTSTSNTVSTTVTPITGFDIVYQSGDKDGTLGDGSTTNANPLPAAYDLDKVKPGDKVATPYTVLNNSNIDGYRINIAADTTGTGATPASVKYYLASTPVASRDSTTEISFVTLNNGQSVDIVQVITVPGAATATTGQQFSASPKGTAPASTDATQTQTAGAFAQYLEATNVNTPVTSGDLQYTRATITKPNLDVIPPTTKVTPADPTAPVNPGPTPPSGVTPPLTYTPPTNPGITNNPGTVITADPASDNQNAYPKADNDDTNADVVTFVSKVKNLGDAPDTIYVLPVLPAGATSFKVLAADGTELFPETGTGPSAGRYLLPGGAVGVNDSVEYQLVVTYPDSDSKDPQAKIETNVGVYSGNVPTLAPVGSKFTIYPPQMDFGDTVTGTPDTANAGLTRNQIVDPSSAVTAHTLVDPVVSTDRSAIFPMTVENNGTYNEAFILSGTVTITNRDGTTTPVNVKYYTADGVTEITETGVVAAGGFTNVLAVVDVPSTAAATTGPAGTPTTTNPNPVPTLTQTATGKYSGDKAKDVNDTITIIATGRVGVAKFVAKAGLLTDETVKRPDPANGPVSITGPVGYTATGATSAAPRTSITYRIIAKNEYNSPVSAFFISDSVPTNTVFKSVALKTTLPTGAVAIYKVGNGSWSATPPAADTSLTNPPVIPAVVYPANTVIYIAVDNDGATGGFNPSPLAINTELSVEFVVTVK